MVDDSVSTVILYRDRCCYQNRNVTLSNAHIHFAVSRRKTIFQKFLEKGHTWLEVESVHSAIEGKLRGRQIFWPAENIDVLTAARRDRPYEVKQVDDIFFRDFSKLNYLNSIRPGSSAGDPQVVDLPCLQYLPDGSVSFKINYTDLWRPLPQRRRKNKTDDNTITKMCKAPMRITSTKWQHLQQLKKVLPKDYHHFNDALPHGDCMEIEHRNLVSSDSKAGTPGHQRNMLSSLRIITCMVLSYD